ncbi:MAG: hypothetical protein ACXVWF_08115, partial [Actinomycetota bacterium]
MELDEETHGRFCAHAHRRRVVWAARMPSLDRSGRRETTMEKQLDANWVSVDAASRSSGVSITSILAWCSAGLVRSIAQTGG